MARKRGKKKNKIKKKQLKSHTYDIFGELLDTGVT